nr:hypothetical protein Hi04_10k_c5218_00014 [uncultured bacterium]
MRAMPFGCFSEERGNEFCRSIAYFIAVLAPVICTFIFFKKTLVKFFTIMQLLRASGWFGRSWTEGFGTSLDFLIRKCD